jgi:hypothetical protein
MNNIRTISQSLKKEIKNKFFNKHTAKLRSITIENVETERVEDQYKDYLHYYQQATRWK